MARHTSVNLRDVDVKSVLVDMPWLDAPNESLKSSRRLVFAENDGSHTILILSDSQFRTLENVIFTHSLEIAMGAE